MNYRLEVSNITEKVNIISKFIILIYYKKNMIHSYQLSEILPTLKRICSDKNISDTKQDNTKKDGHYLE